MSDNQAGALVIKNIAIIEEAIALVKGEVSAKVFNAIDETIKNWAETMKWEGSYNFTEDKDTYFGPSVWTMGTREEDWLAWFCIQGIETGTPDEYWLTYFLAARNSRIGFQFKLAYQRLGNVGKVAWRNFAVHFNQSHPEIEQAGFEFEATDGTWMLPWQLDSNTLAESYLNDAIEDALEPLQTALERVKTIYPVFAELVESAQRQIPIQ